MNLVTGVVYILAESDDDCNEVETIMMILMTAEMMRHKKLHTHLMLMMMTMTMIMLMMMMIDKGKTRRWTDTHSERVQWLLNETS